MQICKYVNLYIFVEFSVQEKQPNMEWMKTMWINKNNVTARKKQAKLLKKMSFTKQDSEETNSVITDGGSQVLNGHHSDHSDDHFGPLLITSDHIRPLLTISDHIWSLLIASANHLIKPHLHNTKETTHTVIQTFTEHSPSLKECKEWNHVETETTLRRIL